MRSLDIRWWILLACVTGCGLRVFGHEIGGRAPVVEKDPDFRKAIDAFDASEALQAAAAKDPIEAKIDQAVAAARRCVGMVVDLYEAIDTSHHRIYSAEALDRTVA